MSLEIYFNVYLFIQMSTSTLCSVLTKGTEATTLLFRLLLSLLSVSPQPIVIMACVSTQGGLKVYSLPELYRDLTPRRRARN